MTLEERIAARYAAKRGPQGQLVAAIAPAQKRNDDLGKLAKVFTYVESRGAMFDDRDRVKLDRAYDKALKIGQAGAKVAERILRSNLPLTGASKPALQMLDLYLKDWKSNEAQHLSAANESNSHVKVNQGNQTIGAAALVNVGIIDVANAVAYQNPNEKSVREKELAKLR
jgi:hypothetical protein